MTYDTEFFDTIRTGAQASAEVIVPLVLGHIPAAHVVDVGCGEGWFGKAFQDAGADVVGLDGDYAEPVIPSITVDLEQRVKLNERYGLAVCLEVAEHLTPGRADSFITDLCALAPYVLFSAAIPGQGGTGHLNEQWPQYWTDRFDSNGYACSGALRWAIWTDDRVENWYRQNLIVATAHPEDLPGLFDTPLAPVFPVVHPVLYDARR